MSILADKEFLKAQYRESSKFDARVDIYKLYTTNEQPWLNWLFEHLHLGHGESVLELGCGTGNVWHENRERIPANVQVVLSDLSAGMLQEARRRLVGTETDFTYREIDAQRIPFPDESFDVILANHMLYHVPNRAKALSEVYRVLKSGGRFYVGTNDWTHLQELRELVTRFNIKTAMLPPGRIPDFFDLENAAEELLVHFSKHRLYRRRDVLKITESRPLLDNIRSMMLNDAQADSDALEALAQHVECQINLLGSFDVAVSVGVFEALK